MSSRPFAALTSLVLAVLGVVFLLPPDCAYACSCAVVGSQKERVEQAISDSDAVFSGEVVEVDKSPPPDKEVRFNPDYGDTALVTLQVSDVWMGPEQETLEVSTPVFGASCGYPFKEGQEYLVYAYGGKDLKVVLCSETKELSRAGADLTLLANSEKPKDGSNDEEALSDTSGGVSARVIAGMAGLAMAASLLVVVRLVRTG